MGVEKSLADFKVNTISLEIDNYFPIIGNTFLSLYPLPELPEFPGTDKTHHLVAYFFLALPSGLRKPKKWVLFVFYL